MSNCDFNKPKIGISNALMYSGESVVRSEWKFRQPDPRLPGAKYRRTNHTPGKENCDFQIKTKALSTLPEILIKDMWNKIE